MTTRATQLTPSPENFRVVAGLQGEEAVEQRLLDPREQLNKPLLGKCAEQGFSCPARFTLLRCSIDAGRTA